jgi:CRISPR-associated protein Cas2
MRTVIAFDVSDDRKRYRVVRALHDYSVRVQKSVFEAPELPRAAYLRLRSRLEGIIDARTDSLRYYTVCAACAARIDHAGAGPGFLDAPEPFAVV